VTKVRVSFSEACVEGNFRPTEDAQQCLLAAKQPQPVEHHVAGSAALEDAVEAGAQDLGLLRAGRLRVFLQGTIEPSAHPLGDLDGVALLVVGGNQLVDEALGMTRHSAWTPPRNWPASSETMTVSCNSP
jgi:hypothetical protein